MIIKHIPEDFIVQEVLVTDCAPQPDGREFLLFQLDKKGYSTFDATHRIEEWFGIENCASAGLKDSDGVTSQKISVPIRYQDMIDRLEAFNRETRTEKTFIHLSFLGYAAEPLKPARLEGNVFRLRLRDMDSALAQSWLECQIYTLSYPNYFDKQRFGIPGYVKLEDTLLSEYRLQTSAYTDSVILRA